MNNKNVFIIILNYNHLDDLKETVTSFIMQNYKDIRIIVSDNGSDDNSVAWLKEAHQEIKVIENGTNLGWAEGNNVGISYALEQNADFILLANNDLSFTNPYIIHCLIQQMRLHENWIMGPVQYYYSKPEQIYNQGNYFMNISKPVFNKIRNSLSDKIEIPLNLKVVDYVAGSFVLFPSRLINDIGFIDPHFYLYGEDADFFLRSWKKGYISLVDTNLNILHKVSATSGMKSNLKKYYQSRNIWRNLQKHRDISRNLAYFRTKALIGIFKNILIDFSHMRFSHIKAITLGMWHGLVLRKYGQYY